MPLLKTANKEYLNGNLEKAYSKYLEIISKNCLLEKLLFININNIKAKKKAENVKDKIIIFTPNLSINSSGRAFTIAQIYSLNHEVQLVGLTYSENYYNIWEPLRNLDLNIVNIKYFDFEKFINDVIEFAIFNYCENIHVSKQRLPSIIFGLTYKLIWGSKIIIDVDDNELGIVKAESSLEIDEFLKKNRIINKNANILGKKYTQISESLIQEFDGVTAANKYFAAKYSGCLLRHARDIYKNKFDKNKRILIRENLSIPDNARVIVFLGSPRKYKGIIEIADAIIKSKLKQVIYLIIGTFSDKEKFIKQELLKKEDLKVCFLDNIDFDDISSFLSCADLAVIFQDQNSNVGKYQTPAKLSDALINGLKVITNETEGISDLIEYNLFDISSKEDLSEKIIESLSVNLRENYKGDNIKEIFSLESNNKKLIKYINHNQSKVIDKKLLSLTLTGILGKKIEKLSQQYLNNSKQNAFEDSISASNLKINKDKNERVNILKDRAYYENNLSCYEELITNHKDNLTINEIVKMSSKLFDYDFFITSENLLSIAIKRNNELPKVKELIYKQFYYHTFTNWLMKTTEGFSDWSKFYGLSFEYEIDKTYSIMSEFNKDYYSIRRNFLIILLIKFDESVYKRDIELKTETLKIILKFLKIATNEKIYNNIFNTLFNHQYVYSQSEVNQLSNKKNKYKFSKYNANIYLNKSEKNIKLLKNIHAINFKVLPYNQWKNLELIFNWFGFYKIAFRINKKAKKLVYSQLKINNQNIDNLKKGIKESFLSGDFKKSKEYLIHLQNIIPKSSFVMKANAFIKLMEGDLNNFRKLWPIKNKSNNYNNYLRDKRIAIVGPSSPNERNSEYIDNHDVVIRFNYRNPIDESICKYIGEKTNVSIYNSHTIRFLNKLKDKDINNAMNKLDFLILRKFNHEFISNTKANVRIIEECDEIFDLYLNSYAALIFDLILCGVNSISIFNLDFFTNSSHHYVNYRGIDENSKNIDNNLLLKPIFANHEIHFQRIFMSRLFSQGILDPTKKIIDLLSLKQKDYINILSISNTKKTSNIKNFLKKKVTNILQKADYHFIKKNFNESLVNYERAAYFDINLFNTKEICNYTRILRNFSLFEKADKILEHFLLKYDLNFELIESYCNIAFYKKNYLETIKRWKKLLLLSNRIKNKSKASDIYNKSCYHIGVSYGNINSFSKANYYLNLYSENIDLPIEKQNKFSLSKSINKYTYKNTKKFNLKILCIFDDDSTMFVALDFMKQFSPFCDVDLALITSKNRSKLSERQLKSIKGDLKFITIENQDLIKNTRAEFFSSYNVLVTSKSIPVNCNFFKEGKERPLILSLYMGIDFFPVTGFINRKNSDILCVVQKSHIESYKKVIPKKIINYQSVLHYNPKFYRTNNLEIPKKKVIKNIYFLAQAIVPLSLKGRLHILNLLIQIAEKYSDKNIIIKLRHLQNENLNHAHMEDYPYELLGKDLNLPSNISFSAESFNKVLSNADYCITCSSTAGIETALSNIPTSFYLNYPDSSKEPMTKASLENFAESGLLLNSNEILDLKINSLNKKWASDFISDDSSVLKVIQKISEFQKNY